MGGHSCGGLFEGTSGSRKTSDVPERDDTPQAQESSNIGSLANLSTGNTFRENLLDLMALVPLNRNGFFGIASKRKGTRGVQVVECSDPVKIAYKFQSLAGKNYSSIRAIPGKGHIMTMRDGTIIKYRMFSSSNDKSPVVELEITGFKRVKSQKIHFVQRSQND